MSLEIDTLRNDVTRPFDLARLMIWRRPSDLGATQFLTLPETRVNHYLVKDRGLTGYHLGEIACPAIEGLLHACRIWNSYSGLGLDLNERYCYITLDQGWVEPGETLRNPGWHIDGLQGDEVPVKQPGDLKFLWYDCLPPVFAVHGFNVRGLDMSKHNVFDWLGRQAIPERTVEIPSCHLLAMGSYHVHQATPAMTRIYRRFLKISYSHVPITSVRMTINPEMEYSYPIHLTTGAIPEHLA